MKRIISILLSLAICSTCLVAVAVSPSAGNTSHAGDVYEQTMLAMNTNMRNLPWNLREGDDKDIINTLRITISDQLTTLFTSYQSMTKAEKSAYGTSGNFLNQINEIRSYLIQTADLSKNGGNYQPVMFAFSDLGFIYFWSDDPNTTMAEATANHAKLIQTAKSAYAALTANQKKSVDALLRACSYDFKTGTSITVVDILNTYQAIQDNQTQLQSTLDYFYDLNYEGFCDHESESESLANNVKSYHQFKTAYEALSADNQKIIKDYWFLYTNKRMNEEFPLYGTVLNNLKTFEPVIEDYSAVEGIYTTAFSDDTSEITKEVKKFKVDYEKLNPEQKTTFNDYIKVNHFDNAVKYVNKLSIILDNLNTLKPLFQDYTTLESLSLSDSTVKDVTMYQDFTARYTALSGTLKFVFDDFFKQKCFDTADNLLLFKGKILSNFDALKPVMSSFDALNGMSQTHFSEKSTTQIAEIISSAINGYTALSPSNQQLFGEYSSFVGYPNYKEQMRVFSAILDNLNPLAPLFDHFSETIDLNSITEKDIKAYNNFKSTYSQLTSEQKAAYQGYIEYEYQIKLDDYFKLYDIVTTNVNTLQLVLANFELLNEIEPKDLSSDKVSPIITDTVASYNALTPTLKTAFNDYYSIDNNPNLHAAEIITICTDFVNNWPAFKPFFQTSNETSGDSPAEIDAARLAVQKRYNSFTQKQKDVLNSLYQLGKLGTPPKDIY